MAVAALAAGAALVLAASVQKGLAARQAAKFSSEALKEEAKLASKQQEAETARLRDRVRAFQGAQRAAAAAQGLAIEGSPLSLIADTAAEGALEELGVAFDFEARRQRLRTQASLERFTGDQALFGSVLQGSSRVIGTFGGGALSAAAGPRDPGAGGAET